ncbi:MAG: hypothetical protein ACFB5Z_05690 [Elainellaceae cyanobacterium]
MVQDIEKMLGEILPEINFLRISNSKIIPGSLLESPEIDQWIGNIQDILSRYFNEEEFETEVIPAALNLQKAQRSFSGDAATNILGLFGFSLKRQSQFSLNIDIAQVKVRQFKSSKIGVIQLENVFRKLKDDDEAMFRSLRRRFLVFSSFYASQLRLEFSALSGGRVDLQTNLEKVNTEIDFSVQKDVLFVSKNDAIPFGVFGYRITRSGMILEA